MPKKTTELPRPVRNSDRHAQEIFRKTHDSAIETYEGDESRAHRVAYAALKHEYKKEGGRWVPKGRRGPSDPQAARGPTTTPSSTDPPTRTGGVRVVEERSRDELYERAKELDISGRSRMKKEDLAVAVREQEQSRRR